MCTSRSLSHSVCLCLYFDILLIWSRDHLLCVCFTLIHLVSNNVSSIFHNETFISHFIPDVMTSIYTHDLITSIQEKINISVWVCVCISINKKRQQRQHNRMTWSEVEWSGVHSVLVKFDPIYHYEMTFYVVAFLNLITHEQQIKVTNKMDRIIYYLWSFNSILILYK